MRQFLVLRYLIVGIQRDNHITYMNSSVLSVLALMIFKLFDCLYQEERFILLITDTKKFSGQPLSEKTPLRQ